MESNERILTARYDGHNKVVMIYHDGDVNDPLFSVEITIDQPLIIERESESVIIDRLVTYLSGFAKAAINYLID